MIEFEKYQHIERLGTVDVSGILCGECHIFPKLDGANGSVWLGNGEVKTGSRNRECTIENDNQGFAAYVQAQPKFMAFFSENEGLRLYGEWLCPHSLKTYRKDAWRKFYVFDVMRGEEYLTYDEYVPILEAHGIEYVPVMHIASNPTDDWLISLLNKTTFLLDEGHTKGEGIVIKRYGYVNRYGRTVWAKIVTNEFKEKHGKEFNAPRTEFEPIEMQITEKYITPSFVEKTKAKITNGNEWESRMIPVLLGRGYNEFLAEEITHIIKHFKSPVIDFKKLHDYAILKIKEYAGV